MLENIKGSIFDMDGTLVDSMWVWSKIDKEYIEELGLKMDPKQLMADIAHFSFNETANYFKEQFKLKESVEEIKDFWNSKAKVEYGTNVKLKGGAFEFLKELKNRGVKTAIATSNSRELLEVCLKANNILDLIDFTVTTDESKSKSKVEPDVFLIAANKMGVDPKDIVVFEDVSHAMVGANKAGMKVIGIKDKYTSNNKEDIAHLCDAYLDDFTSLLTK